MNDNWEKEGLKYLEKIFGEDLSFEELEKKFRNQLHVFEEKTHGGYNVNLLSKTNEIYGLIFASYVSENKDKQLKKNFYNTILEKANESLRHHDLSKPYFRMAYDDKEIKVLNSFFYNTLKIGLWKIISRPKGT